jgi:exopolysaccharide biosynthesis protein
LRINNFKNLKNFKLLPATKKSFNAVFLTFIFLINRYGAFAQTRTQQTNIVWQKVADGIEMVKLPAYTPSIFAPEVTFIKIDINKYNLRVVEAHEIGQKQAFVKEIAEKSAALLAINASFFDEHGETLGLVIKRGVETNRVHKGGSTLTGVFAALEEPSLTTLKPQIFHRDERLPSTVVEAVQAGPRLIVKGKPTYFSKATVVSQRSGVYITDDGELVFFISNSWPLGISFKQLQKLLMQPELRCYEALNFDGGGSAQLYLKDAFYAKGSDPVPTALAIFAK